MKATVCLSAIVMSVGLTAASTASAAIDPSTERVLVKVCKALKTDNQARLRHVLKRNHLGYRQIAEGLRCNGQDALTFAMSHGAEGSAYYLARKANIDMSTLVAKLD
ncbi:DUF3718 domain-containing protein [Aestuariibacter sp. AA17]|uniref:DUF3718 domain-containing protein n=1 Tax=Fluctibacter corallii TaxID=2984329 RepID=A0ABT3A896_9ALTE|nr:DUF3718 domain-containing protein [Aestuariibacter sp. AA17]MCV2884799.1 DUF3718 domain-containing protein [Aestuariibacter sp. AA17]